MKTGKIWNVSSTIPLRSSKLVKRFLIDENLPAGWLVKWGGEWDIAVDGKLIPTGLKSLEWTGDEWKQFILKHLKKN